MTTLPAIAPELLGFATCPSCHTTDATMTNDAVGIGTDRQCARCGQKWSATRLAPVAAYAVWVSGQTTQYRGNA
jgi:hypothetical protein